MEFDRRFHKTNFAVSGNQTHIFLSHLFLPTRTCPTSASPRLVPWLLPLNSGDLLCGLAVTKTTSLVTERQTLRNYIHRAAVQLHV